MMTEYLTTDDAAKILHVSTKTLERLRTSGTGPEFTKVGRRVLYRRSTLDNWLDANTTTSTSARKNDVLANWRRHG